MIEIFFMLYLIQQKEAVKMMNGEGKRKQKKTKENRRKQKLEILKNEAEPISGTEPAKRLKVSRQVIVQDMIINNRQCAKAA